MHGMNLPRNSWVAVFTATRFVEYRISFTTLLYTMGRPSVKAATSLKFPPACHLDFL